MSDEPNTRPKNDEASPLDWAFPLAALILMIPPLIPIVAAFAPGWIPLPIDLTVPETTSSAGWTFFLVALGITLLVVNLSVLFVLHRWSSQ